MSAQSAQPDHLQSEPPRPPLRVVAPDEGDLLKPLTLDDLEDTAATRGLPAGDLPAGVSEPGRLTGQPVDLPGPARRSLGELVAARRDGAREPVLPTWLATPADRRATAAWLAEHGGHLARFHGARLPVYAAKVAVYAPIGAARTATAVTRFVIDAEGRPVRAHAVDKADPKAYLLLAKERNTRVARRLHATTALSVLAALVVALAWWLLPWPVFTLAAVGLVLLFAKAGAPQDKPILGHAVARAEAPRLTSQAIVNALGGLGIAALSQTVAKGRTAELFPGPITRMRTGFMAPVDLPFGVTAAEVAERRAKLASGLRRPIGAVWPERDHDAHEGRLLLYVLDKPMSKMPQPAWPLTKAGRADIFAPLPYGYDQRGDLVCVPLMYSNLLVGAIPRQGKSFAVRVVVLGAALDPTVELHVHELKGTGDFEGVQGSCHRYASGPADEQTLAEVMASIREVHSYLQPRARTIAKLGPARCPEKKTTRALADDRGLGLWPVLLVIDEVQELFESDHAAEAEQLLKAIIKRGPALGIMLILATQRPDAKSLPTSITSNMGHRLCLRVGDQQANDMVLGTSAYRIGMNATLFTDADLGVGLLRTGGVAATTVRSSYLDAKAADQIGRRAHALRTAAGTLTGTAAGEELAPSEDKFTIVVDAIEVWTTAGGDDTAWLHTLEQALAEQFPDRYGDLDGSWLGERLRALGITTQAQRKRRVDGEQINRAGIALTDLRHALETPTG